MTKAEKQRMADMEEQIRLLKALRWTEEVLSDVPPPTDLYPNTLSTGFVPDIYSLSTLSACSAFRYHEIGRTISPTARGSISMYSTRLLALRGLRYQVELECAKKLARIDAMIEAEQKGESHGD